MMGYLYQILKNCQYLISFLSNLNEQFTNTNIMFIDYHFYSEMLSEQVEMCFPFEKSFFQRLELNNFNHIGEVGCGNGSFLKKLSEHYPAPYYKGYDHCDSLISIAKQYKQQNLEFEIGSANSLGSYYDLIILRLIVHQLENRTLFFTELSCKLEKNSKVIVIEPYDEMFHISSDLPAFNKHLIKHREILSPNTASRNVKTFLEQEMNVLGFHLQDQFYYYIPSILPGYKDKYYRYMKSTCLITGCGADVLEDIEQWYLDPFSFVQIGLIVFGFIKRE